MSEPTINITNLTKTFADNVAVNQVNLAIQPGELFGLVGPDGAGKTTILRMLAAILRPTSGEAHVAGHSILTAEEPLKEQIGYMSQRFGLYEELSVIENIDFYADLYAVPAKERAARTERLLGFSNLTPFKNRLAGKLSGGMKQKLGLACALIHTPQVLLLDEPTNGVDPVSRRDFWRILYDLLQEGITILVSTAYLDEAERCTRIGLLHQGRLLMVDTPARVKQSLGQPMTQLWVSEARKAAAIARTMSGIGQVSMYGDSLHVTTAQPDAIAHLTAALQAQGLNVKGQRAIQPSLEDIFIAMIEQPTFSQGTDESHGIG